MPFAGSTRLAEIQAQYLALQQPPSAIKKPQWSNKVEGLWYLTLCLCDENGGGGRQHQSAQAVIWRLSVTHGLDLTWALMVLAWGKSLPTQVSFFLCKVGLVLGVGRLQMS